jgi:hypothetical protein
MIAAAPAFVEPAALAVGRPPADDGSYIIRPPALAWAALTAVARSPAVWAGPCAIAATEVRVMSLSAPATERMVSCEIVPGAVATIGSSARTWRFVSTPAALWSS